MLKLGLFFILLYLLNQSDLAAEKTAVLIAGAPRSGTSATTGVLRIMGLELGDDLVGPLPDNQKGHFEDSQVVSHNRMLYRNLGSKHAYTGLYIPDAWFQSHDGLYATQEIKTLLHKRFGAYRCFGIKNPLLSLFLPSYLTAARALFYVPKLIIVLRNPLEIAYSIQRRTNLALDHILNVVTNYLSSIYRSSISIEKIVILFDDLLHKTKDVALKLVEFLPDLTFNDDTEKEIQEFLDRSLKHHDYKRCKRLTPKEQHAYQKALSAYNLLFKDNLT